MAARGRNTRKKEDTKNVTKKGKEIQESEDIIYRSHRIYFYTASLVRKPCWSKDSIWPHYHNDTIYCELPEKNRGYHEYMWQVYRGYPKCETHFQIRETNINIEWTLSDRTNGVSIYFHQIPCQCGRKCCRGENKQAKRFCEATRSLKFDDGALYYKVNPVDNSKGELYHFPMHVWMTRRPTVDYELFENTKSIVFKHAKPKPPVLRNAVGQIINVGSSAAFAYRNNNHQM